MEPSSKSPPIRKFSGFSSRTFAFLAGLKAHNTKAWFEAHKVEYQADLLAPFQSLFAALAPHMLEIDPGFEVLQIAKCISRIYRDVRFSKDKSPYRANMWLTFRRPTKDWKLDPVFFFELMSDSYHYGMGFYSPDKSVMNALRGVIDATPDKVLKLNALLASHSPFELLGAQYKRPVSPAVARMTPELASWYQRKEIYAMRARSVEPLLYQDALADRIAADFMQLKPLYEFFWELRSISLPPAEEYKR